MEESGVASLMPKILQHSWRPNDNAPPCASLFELTSARAPSVQHNCHGRAIRRSILSLSCLSECLMIDGRQDRWRGECAKFGAFLALAICPQLRSLSLRESELSSLSIRHPLTITCPLSTRRHRLQGEQAPTPQHAVRPSIPRIPRRAPSRLPAHFELCTQIRGAEIGMEFACRQKLLRL